MKVIASKAVNFPSLDWGIGEGEIKDLPDDKIAQDEILKCYVITKVDGSVAKPTPAPATEKGE